MAAAEKQWPAHFKPRQQCVEKTATYIAAMNDAGIINLHINLAEDERTATSKKQEGKNNIQTRRPSGHQCWRKTGVLE